MTETGQSVAQPVNRVRWTVSIPRETDILVRRFLAHQGVKKGGLSKFVEEAVLWRMLNQTLTELREQGPARQSVSLEALKADIGKGLDDLAAGRVCDFDLSRLIARGRRLLAEQKGGAG
jgi:hypothetical protein